MSDPDAAGRATERLKPLLAAGWIESIRGRAAEIIREEYAKDAPKWTTERPTEPGWYWTRPGGDSPIGRYAEIVQILKHPDKDEWLRRYVGCVGEFLDLPRGELSGPIRPPT